MGRSKPLRRPTVLIVEDDEDQRFLVSTLFEESDLNVIECASAEAAVAILAENSGNIALVFTDVRLSGHMDGVDLARMIGAKYPGVAVLITSGFYDRLNDLPDGAEFVQKPWFALDLLRKAERLRAVRT
jgi:DNA-binding NtrC family response regulator